VYDHSVQAALPHTICCLLNAWEEEGMEVDFTYLPTYLPAACTACVAVFFCYFLLTGPPWKDDLATLWHGNYETHLAAALGTVPATYLPVQEAMLT